MNNLRLFLIAVQFLTCIPVRLHKIPEPVEIGRSVLFYPPVGLLLGAALAVLNLLLHNADDALRAALLLVAWVIFSGALHLDGLADSADAMLGGMGDARKTMAIMKDPHCGPLAVVALLCVLLLKFAALSDAAWLEHPWSLIWIPLLGRMSAALLFAAAPYASPGGLGSALAAHLPRTALLLQAALVSAACVLLLGTQGLALLIGCAALFAAWRGFWLRRLGGVSGDIAGALVELTETVALLALLV